MPHSNAQLRGTAEAFITALSSLNVDEMIALRSADCQQFIFPASLARPPMSNDDFRAQYTGLLSAAAFKDYNIKINHMIVDEAQSKVALHADGFATTIAGPFNSEYIFFITVSPEGLISRVEEFVDSKLSAEEGGRIRAALEAKKQ